MNQKAYLVEKDTLSDIANQVRRISETNKMYTPSEMVNALSKYDPNGDGIILPDLTNEGTASDLLSGKQLIDGDGNIVTGTIATRTTDDLTTSGPVVNVPSGYYSDSVYKPVTVVNLATPEITVSDEGQITAKVVQPLGWTPGATKTATQQLTVQAAQTITPSTSNKTIASGRYLTGTQTIKGDANLKAENIAEGITIFGVTGTHSGGGNTDMEDSLITRNFSTYTNDRVTSIGICAFQSCSNLTTASFPNAITIGANAFCSCSKLTSISVPNATTIGSSAFVHCTNLTSISFPNATTIGANAFCSCSKLTSISVPNATTIGTYAFGACSNLTTASFPSATTIGTNAFYGCTNLTTVSFPNATTIGDYAFVYCYNLTTARFPSATTIGNNAFWACSKLTSISVPNATTIGTYAFRQCSNLRTASFPNAITIGTYAFQSCSNLTTASFPNATTIGFCAFQSCSKLTSISFPNATTIEANAFVYCTNLIRASFPNATTIEANAFCSCSKLVSVYFLASTVCTLSNSNAFSRTGIWSTKGSIFVPASLIDSYKTTTNWAFFSKRIFGI